MSEPLRYSVERIGKHHLRSEFSCGVEELNSYIRRYARQNDDLGIGRTFVAVRTSDPSGRVYGYFTLSSGQAALDDLPEETRRRLPRYPVPMIHLGKLAVDQVARGTGLGEHLLLAALQMALRVSESIGALAVEVIAIDDRARSFYLKYGFQELLDDPRHLYLHMRIIQRLLGDLRGTGSKPTA